MGTTTRRSKFSMLISTNTSCIVHYIITRIQLELWNMYYYGNNLTLLSILEVSKCYPHYIMITSSLQIRLLVRILTIMLPATGPDC